ncbi:hypothetical protein AV530_002194 [Patagioenas fasciata monilis]|uniref:Uncharacterized protein n=1 Tax=Patagioenas fasciata monilis TaxID=372326 RepID=A0A1V4K5S0_PATFA|nr:hypothetical protein AV530_002194 [Patagioenas fasciata monilis]
MEDRYLTFSTLNPEDAVRSSWGLLSQEEDLDRNDRQTTAAPEQSRGCSQHQHGMLDFPSPLMLRCDLHRKFCFQPGDEGRRSLSLPGRKWGCAGITRRTGRLVQVKEKHHIAHVVPTMVNAPYPDACERQRYFLQDAEKSLALSTRWMS